MTRPLRGRSKAAAAWLALVAGSFGVHRFYLHGAGDLIGWMYPAPTLVGAYGAWRMRELGVDDRLGGLLVPWLGASLAASMLSAIVYGLMSDERWAARHGGSDPTGAAGATALHRPTTQAWPAIAAVIVALALGATITLATIAFAAQRYFEAGAAATARTAPS